MKPYEHYLEAERLLDEGTLTTNSWEQEQMLVRAGIHAQLAQTPHAVAHNLEE